MADIAFLLLIFFLVTTTIDQDKGILHGLPEWSDVPPPKSEFKERNVLEILVNSNNQLLVETDYIQVSELRAIAIDHISNNGKSDKYSESPQKAIISLKNDRGTSYDTYISIQNELKAAYATLRDAEAYKISGGSMKTYEEISTCAEPEDEIYNNQKQCKQWKDAIKASIPMVISEAEPKNVGGTE